jgi:hypothetical protein
MKKRTRGEIVDQREQLLSKRNTVVARFFDYVRDMTIADVKLANRKKKHQAGKDGIEKEGGVRTV